tara:strand:- start:160 stop:507 length:348 start_codon:yes stop_codon:yes gene_type:complete
MDNLSLLADKAFECSYIKLNKLNDIKKLELRKKILDTELKKVLSKKNIQYKSYFKYTLSKQNEIKVIVIKNLIDLNFKIRPIFVKQHLNKYAFYTSSIYGGEQKTKLYDEIVNMY